MEQGQYCWYWWYLSVPQNHASACSQHRLWCVPPWSGVGDLTSEYCDRLRRWYSCLIVGHGLVLGDNSSQSIDPVAPDVNCWVKRTTPPPSASCSPDSLGKVGHRCLWIYVSAISPTLQAGCRDFTSNFPRSASGARLRTLRFNEAAICCASLLRLGLIHIVVDLSRHS